MTERPIINLNVERARRRNPDGSHALSERRRMLASYYFHLARVRELGESLGVRQEPSEAEMARLAMRVCDLVLAARDERDVPNRKIITDESSVAIRAYEELRERNGGER